MIAITLHRDGAPGSNGSKSLLRPLAHWGDTAKVNRAGVAVQRKQVTLIQDCIADLALTTIQVDLKVWARNKADLAKLSCYYRCVGSTAACGGEDASR